MSKNIKGDKTMYNFLYRLIPSDKRDRDGRYAEKGFKGTMNHFKRFLRYKVSSSQHRNLK